MSFILVRTEMNEIKTREKKKNVIIYLIFHKKSSSGHLEFYSHFVDKIKKRLIAF